MERRLLPRFEVDAPLRVSILGQETEYCGRIANVSQSGLRLLSRFDFPIGEVLRIEIKDHILVGTVRYSLRHEELYRTGVEVENVISRPEFDGLLQELQSEFAFH
jgi:hypothetical protein